ncbi:nuclear transcription factor Y subunit gamma [Zerene cesonia]|uniref:nuclear transcription factor Y subunit gamma n=1 Tax=Zerene cesonia TaxID=33412 RepID=UPI0018E4FC9D|nr:nuclear transcription factor Y subunit gamma [Zerene cesonia]
MSVCFFVPTEQDATAVETEEAETECTSEESPIANIHTTLTNFWAKVNEDVKKITAEDFKTQVLPLARIKKIMKLDEEVKMISAEAPVLFAKAAEIFIHELTLRAWSHTEDNKRRTLQRNDIAMAISRSDQFDFLIDIVPRQEMKFSRLRDETPRVTQPTEQVAQTHQPAVQNTTQFVTQQCAQIVQPTSSTPATTTTPPHPVTLLHHVVNSSGEVQNMPLLLTQAQINMIRLQVQNNPNQPIIIQAQPQGQQQTPQIIQVSSQAPHQPHQIFIAQVASNQEES